MKVERLVFLSIVLSAVCLLANVHAAPNPVPAGDKTPKANLEDVKFYSPSTVLLAEVDNHVYQYDTGDYAGSYLYTYEITCKSTFSLSFFSIAVLEDASIDETGYESGGVEPSIWLTIGSPVQSVDAIFGSSINYNNNSALLWFVSDGDYTLTDASVAGAKSGFQALASEQLYSPIPEPATLVVLGIGGLCLISRKRK
jgi:hypothetical protein